MKFLIFLLTLSLMQSSFSQDDFYQPQELRKVPGAGESLRNKLKCLRENEFPNDIEVCDLAGFSNLADQEVFEYCLKTGKGRLADLYKKRGEAGHRLMLIVDCPSYRAAVELRKNDENYFVVSMGRLVE